MVNSFINLTVFFNYLQLLKVELCFIATYAVPELRKCFCLPLWWNRVSSM